MNVGKAREEREDTRLVQDDGVPMRQSGADHGRAAGLGECAQDWCVGLVRHEGTRKEEKAETAASKGIAVTVHTGGQGVKRRRVRAHPALSHHACKEHSSHRTEPVAQRHREASQSDDVNRVR